MTRKGLFPDEKEILTINVTNLDTVGYYNDSEEWTEEQKTTGELVLTEELVIFLATTGMLKTGRERAHIIPIDCITGLREESKGISLGSLLGKVNLIVAVESSEGEDELVYVCSKEDSQRFVQETDRFRKMGDASLLFDNRALQLVKTREEVSLEELSKDVELQKSLAKARGEIQDSSPEDVLEILQRVVANYITEGDLDGVLENKIYISNAKLARKTVQYQVTIDFTSLFSQLKNKGIILQKIECPSCSGELALPEGGASIVCKFCDSTVHATDIFEKFKALL